MGKSEIQQWLIIMKLLLNKGNEQTIICATEPQAKHMLRGIRRKFHFLEDGGVILTPEEYERICEEYENNSREENN